MNQNLRNAIVGIIQSGIALRFGTIDAATHVDELMSFGEDMQRETGVDVNGSGGTKVAPAQAPAAQAAPTAARADNGMVSVRLSDLYQLIETSRMTLRVSKGNDVIGTRGRNAIKAAIKAVKRSLPAGSLPRSNNKIAHR